MKEKIIHGVIVWIALWIDLFEILLGIITFTYCIPSYGLVFRCYMSKKRLERERKKYES